MENHPKGKSGRMQALAELRARTGMGYKPLLDLLNKLNGDVEAAYLMAKRDFQPRVARACVESNSYQPHENLARRASGACPRCGFEYRWDGTHCDHCQFDSGNSIAPYIPLAAVYRNRPTGALATVAIEWGLGLAALERFKRLRVCIVNAKQVIAIARASGKVDVDASPGLNDQIETLYTRMQQKDLSAAQELCQVFQPQGVFDQYCWRSDQAAIANELCILIDVQVHQLRTAESGIGLKSQPRPT